MISEVDADSFNDDVSKLEEQIRLYSRGDTDDIEEPLVTATGADVVESSIEELARLRKEIQCRTADTDSSFEQGSGEVGVAVLPYCVPELPRGFKTTEQLDKMTHLLLTQSPSEAKLCVGYWGMGGIRQGC